MGERRSSYRDRGAGDPRKSWRPPRPSHGGGNFSVPLWEKKFCTDACAIPWGKLCETRKLMSLYKNIVEWEDSAALESFNDAKARFCAVYHGQPCDIPLPDPDMYIDMVSPYDHIDPELVADLERSRRAVPKRDNAAPNGWDSFIFTDKPVPVTGWGDEKTSNTPGQQCSVNWENNVEQPSEANCNPSPVDWDNHVNQPAQTILQQSSGNWDNYGDQPAQKVIQQSSGNWDNYGGQPAQTVVQQSSGNWDNYGNQSAKTVVQQSSGNWDNYGIQPAQTVQQSSGIWDNYVNQPAQTVSQQSSGIWDVYVEQQSSWGAPTTPCTPNWDMKGDSLYTWNRDHGWGSEVTQIDPLDNQRDNYYVPESQGGSYGHGRRRNNDSGRRNSRNRDRGGPVSSKAMKSRYQADEHSSANNGWRNCRVRDNMHYSYERPGYANQPVAM